MINADQSNVLDVSTPKPASKSNVLKFNAPKTSAVALRQFQEAFGGYLRRQAHDDDDSALVPERVGRLYQELIFNSVANFPQQCFPICKRLLGEQFDTLCRAFFQDYPLHSPYFTQINQDFVRFLESQPSLPEGVAGLAHYEWVELLVDIDSDKKPIVVLASDEGDIALNPSLQNLHYGHVVHLMTPMSDLADLKACETFLLMYRRSDDSVETMQTNALTHLLIEFMQHSDVVYASADELLMTFLASIGGEMNASMTAFFAELLDELLVKQVLVKV